MCLLLSITSKYSFEYQNALSRTGYPADGEHYYTGCHIASDENKGWSDCNGRSELCNGINDEIKSALYGSAQDMYQMLRVSLIGICLAACACLMRLLHLIHTGPDAVFAFLRPGPCRKCILGPCQPFDGRGARHVACAHPQA